MARSSDKTALWQAILADREDDLPRLAYADLLEEEGDETRARFIRLQIEQAKAEQDDPRHWRLEAEIRPLWLADEKAWRADLPAWCRERAVFRRGFPYAAGGTMAAVLKSGPALIRKQPVGSLGMVDGTPEQLMTVLSWPEAGRLRELRLYTCEVDERVAAEIGNSPRLRCLRSLSLYRVPYRAAAVSALAGPSLGGLEALHWENWVSQLRPEPSEAQAAAIADGPWRGLRTLRLGSLQMSATEAAILSEGPALRSVRHLDLGLNPLGDAGAEVIVRGGWPALRRLDLPSLGEAGVRALLAWPRLADLRWLGLGHARAGAGLLASSPATRSLVHLAVQGCGLKDGGFAALAASSTLPGLRSLRVGSNGITAAGLRPLLRPGALSALERLDLSMSHCGDEAGRVLLASEHLHALAWLNVGVCNMSPGMLDALRRRFPFVEGW